MLDCFLSSQPLVVFGWLLKPFRVQPNLQLVTEDPQSKTPPDGSKGASNYRIQMPSGQQNIAPRRIPKRLSTQVPAQKCTSMAVPVTRTLDGVPNP